MRANSEHGGPSHLALRDGRGVGCAIHGVLLTDGEQERPRGRTRHRVHQPFADALDLSDGVGAVLEVTVDLFAGRTRLDGEACLGEEGAARATW